jgi:hypothetical protein
MNSRLVHFGAQSCAIATFVNLRRFAMNALFARSNCVKMFSGQRRFLYPLHLVKRRAKTLLSELSQMRKEADL